MAAVTAPITRAIGPNNPIIEVFNPSVANLAAIFEAVSASILNLEAKNVAIYSLFAPALSLFTTSFFKVAKVFLSKAIPSAAKAAAKLPLATYNI
jgi:hypothetical protein